MELTKLEQEMGGVLDMDTVAGENDTDEKKDIEGQKESEEK